MARNYLSDQLAASRIYGWHVYVISVPGFSKIGSATRVKARLCGIQNGNPHPLKIEAVWHFNSRAEARKVEREALEMAGLKRIPKRDWCACTPDKAMLAVHEAITQNNIQATTKTIEEID